MCFCSFSFPSDLVGASRWHLKLDVTVHSIYMFCEGFHVPCSDFDPGVFHIPEPVARRGFCEGHQGSALNFFHVEVGHYWGHQWAHGAQRLQETEPSPAAYDTAPRFKINKVLYCVIKCKCIFLYTKMMLHIWNSRLLLIFTVYWWQLRLAIKYL